MASRRVSKELVLLARLDNDDDKQKEKEKEESLEYTANDLTKIIVLKIKKKRDCD